MCVAPKANRPPFSQIAEMLHDCIIITGSGRSGTTWVHDLLNHSRETHCRNEPDRALDSGFADLSHPWIETPNDLSLDRQWSRVIDRARVSMSQNDREIPALKRHFHGGRVHLSLFNLLSRKPRLRRALGHVNPELQDSENHWAIPSWLSPRPRLLDATLVLKLVQSPGWICSLLRANAAPRIVHVVRHPGGFLCSWKRRWLEPHHRDAVTAANRERLRYISERCPEWKPRFENWESMSAEESELRFWQFHTETVNSAGASNQSYRLVIYEQLVRAPVIEAQALFSHCGLPWEPRLEAALTSSAQSSREIARNWRSILDDTDSELVDRIIDESSLHSWWPS